MAVGNWKRATGRQELDNQMKEMQEKMIYYRILEEYLQYMESNLENELEHLKGFEKELNTMLIEYGYVSEGEEVNIEFSDDEVIVNDSAVKDKHQKKYLELHKKYFPRDDGKFRYRSINQVNSRARMKTRQIIPSTINQFLNT